MKSKTITNIIKGVVKRAELTSKALARETGIPYQTLRYRYKNPTSWKFYEWGAVLRRVKFFPKELETIRKEVAK